MRTLLINIYAGIVGYVIAGNRDIREAFIGLTAFIILIVLMKLEVIAQIDKQRRQDDPKDNH